MQKGQFYPLTSDTDTNTHIYFFVGLKNGKNKVQTLLLRASKVAGCEPQASTRSGSNNPFLVLLRKGAERNFPKGKSGGVACL